MTRVVFGGGSDPEELQAIPLRQQPQSTPSRIESGYDAEAKAKDRSFRHGPK